jgi:hypothetical protein
VDLATGLGKRFKSHGKIVRQTDEKTGLPLASWRVTLLVKHPACE